MWQNGRILEPPPDKNTASFDSYHLFFASSSFLDLTLDILSTRLIPAHRPPKPQLDDGLSVGARYLK